MRTSYLVLVVGAFLATAIAADWYFNPGTTPVPPPAGPIPLDCDRGCLEDVVDQYLDALVANDPGTLPFSEDVRSSENSQMLEVGDGFWKTVTGRGNYAHYFADPWVGEAAFMGTIRERDSLVLMSLRIRIGLGRITEVETVTYRQRGDGPTGIAIVDARRNPEPVWLDVIPPAERLSRQGMIAAANAYFELLEEGDALEYEPFAADCIRIENGVGDLPCGERPESVDLRQVTRVHQRRFPLVDEERGVVWAYSVIDRDGTAAGGPQRASSVQVMAAFLIRGGQIQRMEIVGPQAPYHANSPWEGGLSGQ
jgi:hypothetical protein